LRYSNYEKEKLSLGDVLALDRTRLANERTFLAYLRASIMIGVSSVSIFKLLPDERLLVILAWAMLPTSLLLAIVGAVRSNRLARSLRSIESKMEPRGSDEGSE
jgi:putative membrane protein